MNRDSKQKRWEKEEIELSRERRHSICLDRNIPEEARKRFRAPAFGGLLKKKGEQNDDSNT